MKKTAIRLAGVLAGLMIYAMSVRSQVTYDRILNATHEPGSWLTYSGDYKSWRYSTLDQINVSNARDLTAQWVFQSASLGQFETTPLVIDGILYGTGQDNRAFAIDLFPRVPRVDARQRFECDLDERYLDTGW